MKNLITGLREGDHSSFKEIYEKYHFKVYLFTKRYAVQEADTEDIVQNVFIHIWHYRNNIDVDVTIDAVLFKSCRQEISRWYKKQDSFPSLAYNELREDADVEYESDDAITRQIEQIQTLLEQIPEKRRKIFTLHKFEQRSYKEIAAEMAMTQTAVAKQISKTLQFLKEHTSQDNLVIWFVFIVNYL